MVSVLNGGILITGGSGQLGHSLQVVAAARGLKFAAFSRPVFDFVQPESVIACFEAVRPGLVVNAAAYTAVDAAESDQAAARAGNHIGPLQLAELCASRGIPLIHVSTDYVFDGNKGAPYTEDDTPAPASVYGATKRDGEVAILATEARAIILRTSWVYAAHGKNFARTMLNAARKTHRLRVVADQRGTPTAAVDLATAILEIAARLDAGWRDGYRGMYHATGTGETTWYGFANAIFAAAETFGLQRPVVTPITTAEWPTPARRPADARLDCGRLARIFGCRLPDWRDTLPKIVADLWALDAPCSH